LSAPGKIKQIGKFAGPTVFWRDQLRALFALRRAELTNRLQKWVFLRVVVKAGFGKFRQK